MHRVRVHAVRGDTMTPLDRAHAVLRASRQCALPSCTTCPPAPSAEAIARAIRKAVVAERTACADLVGQQAEYWMASFDDDPPGAASVLCDAARSIREREAP